MFQNGNVLKPSSENDVNVPKDKSPEKKPSGKAVEAVTENDMFADDFKVGVVFKVGVYKFIL